MSLTREKIEERRIALKCLTPAHLQHEVDSFCDLAIRGLEAQQSATIPPEVTSEMEDAGIAESKHQYNLPVTRASVCAIWNAMLAAAPQAQRVEGMASDIVLSAIESEPEVPGHMPDEMWDAMRNDRDAVEECIRIAVRQTKEGIRERYLAAVGTPDRNNGRQG